VAIASPHLAKFPFPDLSFRCQSGWRSILRRQVKFRSLTEHVDTDTPTGRAMWQMIGLLAELERSLISERTRAGVKDAQRRGVKLGRKPKLTLEQIEHARKLIENGAGRHQVADLFTVDRSTLYGALASGNP
jgi:DNA invertase Pin-like site-specific DNA recombinase